MSDIIQQLRAQLQPLGTAPLVQLRLDNQGIYDYDFISKCIDELEKMRVRTALGDTPSNLERLAYDVLLSSAYIDR